MRFFTSFVVAALAAIATADSRANPFNIPIDGYTFKVGEPTTFTWQPTTSGTVSLRLQWGAVTTPTSGTVIASHIDNSGSYTWDVPSELAAQPDYTIRLVSDENSDDYNFIGRFTVEGATVSVSTTTASSTTTSSASESRSSSTGTTTSESTASSSSSSSSSSPTTLTTASSTSASASASASASISATETSSSATPSDPASSSTTAQTAVPTTDSGAVANRVSGGMLALVAGALLL